MITIPRFLSAGFMVMVDLFFVRLVKALFCFRDKFFPVVLQMFGKLSTTSCFVSSIYFSGGQCRYIVLVVIQYLGRVEI